MTNGLTKAQLDALIAPIKPHRVKIDDQRHSHLPQQDVRAHLTRIFGFGNWGTKVISEALIFEEAATWQDRKTQKTKNGWDCAYKATVRLTIRDEHGRKITSYEDSATGDAQHQTRLAAHDLALKSAVSTALKRAATCLGDQFGLSLYNKGSLDQFVKVTLVPEPPAVETEVPAATEEAEGETSPEPSVKDQLWSLLGEAYPNGTTDDKLAVIDRLLGKPAGQATEEELEKVLSSLQRDGVDITPAEVQPPLVQTVITREQSRKLHAMFNEAGMRKHEEYMAWLNLTLGLSLTTTDDLTQAQLTDLFTALEDLKGGE